MRRNELESNIDGVTKLLDLPRLETLLKGQGKLSLDDTAFMVKTYGQLQQLGVHYRYLNESAGTRLSKVESEAFQGYVDWIEAFLGGYRFTKNRRYRPR